MDQLEHITSFLLNEEDIGSDITTPTSQFHINFESTKAFENPQVEAFLARYGHQVTHLKIYRQKVPLSESEVKFYERLPNLRSLDVVHKDCDAGTTNATANHQQLPFPQVFTNLERLQVDQDCPGYSVWNLIEF